MQKQLMRDPNNKMIAGVCSGLGNYFGVDPTMVRIVFGLGLIFGGATFWIYILLWVVMPEGPVVPIVPTQQWAAPNGDPNAPSPYPSAQYPDPATQFPGGNYEGNPFRSQTQYDENGSWSADSDGQ